jgi:hypothetical protein
MAVIIAYGTWLTSGTWLTPGTFNSLIEAGLML